MRVVSFSITILKGGIIPILLMSKLRPSKESPLPKSSRLPLACDWEACQGLRLEGGVHGSGGVMLWVAGVGRHLRVSL